MWDITKAVAAQIQIYIVLKLYHSRLVYCNHSLVSLLLFFCFFVTLLKKMSSTKLNRIRIIMISIMNTLYWRKPDNKLPKSVEQSDRPVKLNFEYCLRPIYFISRASGLLPFSIARDSNGTICAPRINTFDFLFFIVSISWYLFLTFASFRDIQFWPSLNKSHVLTVSNYSLLIMGLIFGALTITMDISNRTRLVDILKKFIIFDQNV